MEYHPKDILYVHFIYPSILSNPLSNYPSIQSFIHLSIYCCSLCCAYLAFKIEEYNVSVDEYVHVLAPELRQSVAETVLNNEVGEAATIMHFNYFSLHSY